ncbi:MAG: hypothetical protein ACRCYZ_06455, partial [Alphaproteobacteria bacterium]
IVRPAGHDTANRKVPITYGNFVEVLPDVVSGKLPVEIVSTVADIPVLPIGSIVQTLGHYKAGVGAGEYVIVAGTTPNSLVDPQIAPDRYARLLPIRGTNFQFSLLAAGAKNDLTIDAATSTAANQLLAKIHVESPIFGGLIKAEGGQYYLKDAVNRPAVGAKGIGIIGEPAPMTYGLFFSKTMFYFDEGLQGGDFAFNFGESQYVTVQDIGLRGDPGTVRTKGGLFFGKKGTPQASGYANHLIERVNITHCHDGLLMQNSGISTLRDVQASETIGRGVALDCSGDSNLYNIYVNGCNKDTTDKNPHLGAGLYVGHGSNNVNIFGGKTEHNSKGLVNEGANGLSVIGLQYDYNYMVNLLMIAVDDGTQACRGNTAVGCRFLSGGIIDGYNKASIFIDTNKGAAELSISGGCITATGDGAFDTSTGGTQGADVGIYANGNDSYDLHVDGSGIVLRRPGVTNAVFATGRGTKVKLNGSGGKKSVSAVAGAKAFVGFSDTRTDQIAFVAETGSTTTVQNVCETTVTDGVANMDISLQLASATGLGGAVVIGVLPYTNTSSQAASVNFGMITGMTAGQWTLVGYVNPGENKITLWKRDINGNVSLLQGSDVGANALVRLTLNMRVA